MENESKKITSWTSTDQIKLFAQVLSKMAKFFNEMTEQCLSQLSEEDGIKHKHRMIINRQNLRNYENNKNIDRIRYSDQQRDQERKNSNQMIKKMKNHKPKHPVSSFFFFYREKGQQIAKQRGQVLGSKIAKIVGEMWKNMSQEQRDPYEEKARHTRRKYEEEMMQYKINYADEINKLKKIKRQMSRKRRQKLQKQQKMKEIEVKQEENKREESKQERGQNQSGGESSSDTQSSLSQSDSLDILSDRMSDSNRENNSSQQMSNHNDSSVTSSHDQSKSPQEELINLKNQRPLISIKTVHRNTGKKSSKHSLQPVYLQESDERNLLQSFKNDEIDVDKSKIDKQKNQKPKKEGKEKERKIIVGQQKTQVSRPKGPVSSFLAYYKKEGKKLAEKNGIPLGPKAIKLVSQFWKELKPEEKKIYGELAKQSRQKFNEQMEEMKKTYGENIFQKKKYNEKIITNKRSKKK